MPKTSASPFALVERAIISLYDGGVLSPAVLERLLAVFAQTLTGTRNRLNARSTDARFTKSLFSPCCLANRYVRRANPSCR